MGTSVISARRIIIRPETYNIIPLKPTDAALVGRVIEDGFEHDPVCNWILNHHKAALRPFFTILARDYLKNGFGHTTENEEGVALWLPPHCRKSTGTAAMLKSSLLMMRYGGLTSIRRGLAIDKLLSAAKPEEPFYYLFAIAARQAHQGNGLGGRLIEPGLERIAAEKAECYIESSNEKNLSFYLRYGFDIIGDIDPGPDAPKMWLLWKSWT